LVEVINTSFLSGLEERLKGKIDVLLFNPPYVPTSDEELEESLKDPNKIDAAAWAGGTDGRRVLDKLLPKVKVVFVVNWCVDVISKEYLSPRGCFYLVAVHENNPNEIISIMRSQKMKGKVKL
jgi:release factor glutamine methyltransferase